MSSGGLWLAGSKLRYEAKTGLPLEGRVNYAHKGLVAVRNGEQEAKDSCFCYLI
jgi:hypothetical protein